MRMTLREAVRSFSADLLSIYGFKEGEHFYDSANFGNEILTLESSDFDLRFAEDRGYIYVDIRGTGRGNEWYPLMNVLQLIGQDQEEHTVKPEDMLRALAEPRSSELRVS